MQNYNNYKAFIVDDDHKILSMLKMNFEMNGFDCSTVSNPTEAIETVSQSIPDVIISDLQMPILDGFELRKQIMNNNALKDIPFIFLTSSDTEENTLKGYDLEIDAYIPKTTSTKVLIPKIISIIRKNQKMKESAKQEFKERSTIMESIQEKEKIILGDLEINFLTVPFDNTPGGDYIEKVKLDNGKYVFVIADVMGKKWDAWFHSFPFKSYIRAAIMDERLSPGLYDVAKILSKLNSILYSDKPISSHSIALTIILVDANNNTIQVAGAGSLPLLKTNNDWDVQEISPIECALGLTSRANYQSQTINLVKGDRILAFTDGAIEVPNRYGVQLGFSGLMDAMKCYREDNDIDWVEKLVRSYTKNKLTDDLTLFEIKRTK
jgi:DNA-binding response OmpR family regulator